MRRWTAAVVVLLSLTACGPRAADPAAPGAAAPAAAPSPVPLLCHAGDLAATAAKPTGDLDCAAAHRAETVHTGAFAGADASAAKAPAAASAPVVTAYEDCDKRSAAFLGADWRTARLRLGVVVPEAGAWADGARWYRCDLVEVSRVGPGGEPVDRTGSLRAALAPGSDLLLVCNRVQVDTKRRVVMVPPAPCERAHEGEFVGVWSAPADLAYPATDVDYLPFYEGCRAEVGRYVGVPLDPMLAHRAGVVPLLAAAADWKQGDRGVRCYLWLTDRTVTASLKGAGEKGLPINTGQG